MKKISTELGVLESRGCAKSQAVTCAFWEVDQWRSINSKEIGLLKTHLMQAALLLPDAELETLIKPRSVLLELLNGDVVGKNKLIKLAADLPSITQLVNVLRSSAYSFNNEAYKDALKTFYATHHYQLDEFSQHSHCANEAFMQYIDSCPSLNLLMQQLKNKNTLESLMIAFIDWRLPLMLWVNNRCEHQKVTLSLNALTWLQKNKTFMALCLNEKSPFYDWLALNSEAANDISQFMSALKELLSETRESYGVQLPKIVDVGTLWQSLSRHLYMKNLNATKIDQLFSTCHANMGRALAYYMSGKKPSPMSCFVESFSENHVHMALKVDGDILRSLLLMHPDNAPLSEFIVRHISTLNKVIESYTVYQQKVGRGHSENKEKLPPVTMRLLACNDG